MYKIEYGDNTGGRLEIEGGAVNNLNSYARITEINGNIIKIDNISDGGYEKFVAGTDILIHVSASNRVGGEYLGQYDFYKILLVDSGAITLNKAVFDCDLNYEYVQAITVPNFYSIDLKNAELIPPPYDPYKYTGGILIVRCYETLTMTDSKINLRECGIPAKRQNILRPITVQESAANGETDNAKFAGYENHITADRFILNAGDGAAMILCRKFVVAGESRIGNPATVGVQRSRGAVDSVVKPANITNIGGSTILLAAAEIENFNPKLIAKYRSDDLTKGKGLARCFIASNTILPVDEGLYSFDILEDAGRVRNLGVENFGSGNFGDCVNPKLPLNNYATVTNISRAGHKFTYTDKTLNGLTPFVLGGLVLVQVIQDKAVELAGRYICSRILEVGANYIVTEKPLDADLTLYRVQIVSIPEFNNLTIDSEYNAVKKYDGNGGILAVAVNGTFNLENGKLNVEGAGGAVGYGRAGLKYIGNSQDYNRLPLGQGHGSVFILAETLKLNDSSRIGALYSGSGEGGRFGGSNFEKTNQGGGYTGAIDEDNKGSGGGFIGGGAYGGLGGSGFSGGTSTKTFQYSAEVGGYGSGELQGAHIVIISQKIEGLTQSVLSTGGDGAVSGAASYGGGGGNGINGGSGGFCFIYN